MVDRYLLNLEVATNINTIPAIPITPNTKESKPLIIEKAGPDAPINLLIIQRRILTKDETERRIIPNLRVLVFFISDVSEGLATLLPDNAVPHLTHTTAFSLSSFPQVGQKFIIYIPFIIVFI